MGWGAGEVHCDLNKTTTRVNNTPLLEPPTLPFFFCHPLTPSSSFFSRLFSSQDCPPLPTTPPPILPLPSFKPTHPPTSIGLPGREERRKKKATTWRYLVLTLPPAVRWRIRHLQRIEWRGWGLRDGGRSRPRLHHQCADLFMKGFMNTYTACTLLLLFLFLLLHPLHPAAR